MKNVTSVRDGRTWVAWLAAGLLLGAALLPAAKAVDGAPIADIEVTRAVEEQLLRDAAIPDALIDVATVEGIVELTGTVGDLRSRDRATTLAELVRGVRGVVNRIQVKPAFPVAGPDLARDVDNALLDDPATDSYEITVTADANGRVTLTGAVQSWAEKQLAETVASGVYGVTAVDNRLVFNIVANRPDAELAAEIRQRLHWDALVDDGLITVSVSRGKATLAGTVGSAAEKSRARENAWVAGIRDVDASGVNVARWARDPDLRTDKYAVRTDAQITEAINDALLYDPRVVSFDVDPQVSNGTVTLYGTVDNAKARQAAARDASNVVGVRRVKNRIKVRPVPVLADATVKDNVERALARNPYVDAEAVTVAASDSGVVRLTGRVDSMFEKAEAQDAAFQAKGVRRVNNDLSVAGSGLLVFDPYVYDWQFNELAWYVPPVVTYTAKTDQMILDDIESEFFWSPFVDGDDVDITVENGVARLSGTVDSWRERAAATQNALEGGATAVRNRLQVKPEA